MLKCRCGQVIDSGGAIAGILTRKNFLNMPMKVEEVTPLPPTKQKKFRRESQLAMGRIAARQRVRNRRHSYELGNSSDYKKVAMKRFFTIGILARRWRRRARASALAKTRNAAATKEE